MRLFTRSGLLWAALLGPGLTACSKAAAPSASASATPSSTSTAAAPIDAGPIDAGPIDAAAASGPARPSPACLATAMATLEPHPRWLARFEGSPPPDKHAVPALRPLRDLTKLPQSQLAYVRGGRIFAVDLPQNVERALTSGPHDAAPTWSPRGTHLAFTQRVGDVEHAYLIRADGAEPRRLSGAEVQSRPAWSSDGRHLAFFSAAAIVILDLEARTERSLPVAERVNAPDRVGPVFEPGGTRLAFSYNREVHVADAATGKVEQHGWGDRNEVMSLAFSEGALLIAMNDAESRPRQAVVRRLPLDHKGTSRIEVLPSPMLDAGVLLFAAPRGPRIALDHTSPAVTHAPQPGGAVVVEIGSWLRHDVQVFEPARTGRTPDPKSVAGGLPEPRFSVGSPAWAPDGRHLGFVVQVWDKASDSDPLAAGIVAVDTDHPTMKPAHIACGEDPAWGRGASP